MAALTARAAGQAGCHQAVAVTHCLGFPRCRRSRPGRLHRSRLRSSWSRTQTCLQLRRGGASRVCELIRSIGALLQGTPALTTASQVRPIPCQPPVPPTHLWRSRHPFYRHPCSTGRRQRSTRRCTPLRQGERRPSRVICTTRMHPHAGRPPKRPSGKTTSAAVVT